MSELIYFFFFEFLFFFLLNFEKRLDMKFFTFNLLMLPKVQQKHFTIKKECFFLKIIK